MEDQEVRDPLIEKFLLMMQYPFMYRAMIVGVLVSLCAAALGVVLVLKRYSMIGHGLGEVGFAALSLAAVLGLDPMGVAIPMVVTASFFIMWISQRNHISGDVVIGILATAALALGVIVTSAVRGFNIDIGSYMFGSILSVSDADVRWSVALSLVVMLIFALLFHRLFAITYDETAARAAGINVTLYQFILSFLTAVTVVLGMRMMGTMLISSLIIFPAMTARRLAPSFRAMVLCAAGISVGCFVIGLFLSTVLNWPAGACVVAVNFAVLMAVSGVAKGRRVCRGGR